MKKTVLHYKLEILADVLTERHFTVFLHQFECEKYSVDATLSDYFVGVTTCTSTVILNNQ